MVSGKCLIFKFMQFKKNNKDNQYDDTGCTCLGKLAVQKETDSFIDYTCKGIRLYHGYE